jgi:hypothetical protein
MTSETSAPDEWKRSTRAGGAARGGRGRRWRAIGRETGHEHPSAALVSAAFGSWRGALRAAGLERADGRGARSRGHALCAHAQSLRFASPHWPPRHDFEWQLVRRRASDAVSH